MKNDLSLVLQSLEVIHTFYSAPGIAPLPSLRGESIQEIKKVFGPPSTESVFDGQLRDGKQPLEYRSSLYTELSGQWSKPVIINELHWELVRKPINRSNAKDQGLNLYVWFIKKDREWVAVHSMLYDAGFEF